MLDKDAIEKALCEKSFYHFLKYAWPDIDPATFVDGWHLKVICSELEKVERGEIRNIVINIPPRHAKSLVISVAFPAWVWARDPSAQFIATSYAAALSTRDSVKMRRLVEESDWYRKHWGNRVMLKHDQNQKQSFATTAGGSRFSTSVTGQLTGYGCSYFICDDGHNVIEGESEKAREEAVQWWREAVPTRLNDPKTGRKIVIQQRIHEKDIAGWCLANGYHHLVLPAEFEHDHPFRSPLDIRTKDGELLWPERFGRPEVEELKRSLGDYASAGQLQQRPAPRDGGMFNRNWFEFVPAVPAGAQRVRRWDLAATEATKGEDPDYTAGVLMAKDRDGYYYIEDVIRDRLSPMGVENLIKNVASRDGKTVPIRLPQDPGAAGKSALAYMIRQLSGYMVRGETETGSKEVRAGPLSAQAQAGNVKIVRAPWNDQFIEELCGFPNGAHDDMVDAASGAFNALSENALGILDYYAQLAANVAGKNEAS